MIKKYLYPKEIFASRQPVEVTTVLGSCISICLFDSEKKIGGINHYMLPSGRQEEGRKDGQFGENAIPELVRRMIAEGAAIKSIKARIFGGYSSSSRMEHFHIGKSNIEFAGKYLKQAGIPVIEEDTGGFLPRKIQFYTATGEVKMKYIEGLEI